MPIKIIAMSGSTRSGSLNKKLLKNVIKGAEKSGAIVTVVDLRDYLLPLYDGDLEEKEGIPENVKKLKKLFLEHQGLIFSLPEYNSSISAVFKNAIDWISRPMVGETSLQCFKDKVAALLSASTGKMGGIRGLAPARSLLENINVMVIPNQVCVGMANEAFDKDDILIDEKLRAAVENVGMKLVQITQKMHA